MYKSNFLKPSALLWRIDEIASSLGCTTIAEHLSADRASAAVAGEVPFIASTGSSTINHVIEQIARTASVPVEDVDDESFAYVEADRNPIEFGNPDKFAFRFGRGYVIVTRSTRAFDSSHDCIGDETTPLDLVVLSCAVKTSQRDRYVLLRYNDKGMMANPAFASGNYAADSTGRPASDMWAMFDGMLCEMRSVVVDLVDKKIVSLPFYKFRNLGECEAYSLEAVTSAIEAADKVEITDKMDGSFVQMKWMGKWCDEFGLSRRLTSMSGSLNPETNETLAFIYSWVDELEARGMRYTDLCRNYADWTFIFEFIRPDMDSHIVCYDKDRWGIYLLSARNISTGETMFYDELASLADVYNLPVTKCFEGYDLETVLDICHTADVSEREGFVVNIDGWYVKVKLDEFCAISKIVHGTENFNTVIANAARGTFDDLLGKVPMTYHEPLIASAHELFAFDEQMTEYVEAVVASIPKDGEMKDVIAYINDTVPKMFIALVIDAYKSGETVEYLYKNPRHPNPSCWKENEFRNRVAVLMEARANFGG